MREHLKKIEWKKFILGVLFIFLSLVFYFFNTFSNSDNKPKEIEKPSKVAAETEFKGEEKPAKFINPEELDDYVMKAFLQEIVGNDFTLLVNLFPPELLDKDIDSMDEPEFLKYAKETGQKIKEGKDVVKARVLTLESLPDGGTEYQIELEFRDGKKKIFLLATKDGMIVTPIKKLF